MALFSVNKSSVRKSEFSTSNLEEKHIAEKIKRRRLQILVHSCIYYELNQNIISDATWSQWAKELVELQNQYPNISQQICYAEAFKDFDASTGAFLPLRDEWVLSKAHYLLSIQKNFKEESI